MEAVVTLKLAVRELDTLRTALDSYIANNLAITKGSASAPARAQARTAATEASILRDKLNA